MNPDDDDDRLSIVGHTQEGDSLFLARDQRASCHCPDIVFFYLNYVAATCALTNEKTRDGDRSNAVL